MAKSVFRAEVGFGIDLDNQESVWILAGSGAPGGDTGNQDAAPLGSLYTNTTDGEFYRKKAITGNDATDWTKMLGVVDGTIGDISWREPVAVKDDTVYANKAAAETDLNDATVPAYAIDGVTLVEGDRVLFTAITGEGKNVFIVSGTPGSGATFVEDDNPETHGDTIYVYDGTDAGKRYTYNATSNLWVWQDQASDDELGHIRDFIGKSGAGAEDPNYSSTNYILGTDALDVATGKLDAQVKANADAVGDAQGEIDDIETALGSSVDVNGDYVAHTLTNYIDGNSNVTEDITDLDTVAKNTNDYLGKPDGTATTPDYANENFITDGDTILAAIGKLDAALASTSTPTNDTGPYTDEPVDSINTAEVRAVKWLIYYHETGASPFKTEAIEVYAVHNGDATNAATKVDFTEYAKVDTDGGPAGFKIEDIQLTGTHPNQDMELLVDATNAGELIIRRTDLV